MRPHTKFWMKVNWNVQWFHIPIEIKISVIHSSSQTHSLVSHTVSPSLLLINSLTLYIFHLSLNSHFWQSHQLLHPKVTAHTHYVHSMLHCVMESEIKRFSNVISQIPPKHTSWEIKSKSHQNIPIYLWDSNLSKQTLPLPLFLPFSDLWIGGIV